MEVTEELYNWLDGTELAIGADWENGKYVLDPQTSEAFENGLSFGPLVKRLYAIHRRSEAPAELNSLKRVSNPAAKLYNWNVLCKALEVFEIQIDPDTKALIVAGDSDMVSEVLEQIHACEMEGQDGQSIVSTSSHKRGSNPQQKNFKKTKIGPDGSLYIETLDETKPVELADTCLEYLILSFVQNFNIQAKQAAGLLTQGNKYLAHIIVKGLKGQFESVLAWYDCVFRTMSRLTELMENEIDTGALNLILPVLRPGLMARSLNVVQITCQVLHSVGEWAQQKGLAETAWEWFCQEVGGIDAGLFALDKYSNQVKGNVLSMFQQFADGYYFDFFVDQIRAYFPEDDLYMMTILDFLPFFEAAKQAISDCGLVEHWVELAMTICESSEPRAEPAVRQIALTFLSSIWTTFTATIDANEETANQILTIIKRQTRDRSIVLKQSAFALLFYLLEMFSKRRNSFAPIIYKTVTFSLVENHQNPGLREFILNNFVTLFEADTTIPVGVVADPLLKQMHVSEDDSYHYNTFDFDFFVCLARSEQLKLKTAVKMLDLLSRIYIHDYIFTKAASIPFMLITSRFVDAEPIQEFVVKFVKLGLKMITEFETQKRPGQMKQDRYMSQTVTVGANLTSKEIEEESLGVLKRNQILDLVIRVVKLWNAELNEQIKEILVRGHYDVTRVTGAKRYKPIWVALGLFGDAGDIIQIYTDNKGADPLMLTNFETGTELAVYRGPGSRAKSGARKIMGSAGPSERVQQDIERQKKRREQAELQRKQEEERKTATVSRQKRALKAQIDKRKVELGVGARSDAPQIFAEKIGTGAAAPTLTLCDLSTELEQDQRAISTVMTRHAYIMKQLFKQYIMTGYNINKPANSATFETVQHKGMIITVAEFYKMLRDHGVTTEMLSKNEVQTLMKLLNQRAGEAVLTQVDYAGYEEMFVQAAIVIHSKPKRDLTHLPRVASVLALLRYLRDYSLENGVNHTLFAETHTGLGEKAIIARLNNELQRDPNTPMPTGYKRVTERNVDLAYTVPTVLLPPSFCHSMEILDEVIAAVFKFHILEPQIVTHTTYRAVGVLVKPEANPVVTHRYGEVPQPRANDKKYTSQNVLGDLRLGDVLRFEVMSAEPEEREDVLEIAKTLEDVLHSVEIGAPFVINRQQYKQTKIVNRAELMREQEREIAAIEANRKELNRHRRQQELAENMRQLKEEREQRKQVEDSIKEDLRFKEEYRQRQINEKLRREREERARQIAEHNEYRESQKAAGQVSFNEVSRQSSYVPDTPTRRRSNQEFLRQQKRKLTQSLNAQRNRREEERRAQEEMQYVQHQKREREKAQVLKQLKDDREKRKRDKQREKEFYKLYNTAGIQSIMRRHEALIGTVFKFYTAQQGVRLEPGAEPGLTFQNYNKFASDFNFWPGLFSREDCLLVFRYYTKDSNSSTLSIEDFKEAIVKFSMLGKYRLRTYFREERQTDDALIDAQDLQNLFAWMEISDNPGDAMKKLVFLQENKQHPRDRRKKATDAAFRVDEMGQMFGLGGAAITTEEDDV